MIKDRNPFISLNFKLSSIMAISLAITIALYFIIAGFEQTVTEKRYTGEVATKENINRIYDEFEQFINENHISSEDSDQIQKWLEKNQYIYLMIYDNQNSLFDGGWRTESKKKNEKYAEDPTKKRAEIPEANISKQEKESQDKRITPGAFKPDLKNRIVTFSNGQYYVYIDSFMEEKLHKIMLFLKVILCVSTFVSIILIYNAHVLKRIITLSQNVDKISGGDLYLTINSATNDEIGKLAKNVNHMRDSIVEKLHNEKEAWDANTQLITAMSHDIRTPLTSLIGYLDIIDSGKYSSYDDISKFICSCKEKALQLKDLSDKLFQYFLVFGSQETKNNLEIYDANILLQQILSEHIAELMGYGFKVDFRFALEEATFIRVDLSFVRRLFDNIFSNILKYADRAFHVDVDVSVHDEKITVRIINGISETSRQVESNNIGLKTCEKICSDMGGEFHSSAKNKIFTAVSTLPIYDEEQKENVYSLENLEVEAEKSDSAL